MFPSFGPFLENYRIRVVILAAKLLATLPMSPTGPSKSLLSYVVNFANSRTSFRMNRRKADFKFAYKFLEDDV